MGLSVACVPTNRPADDSNNANNDSVLDDRNNDGSFDGPGYGCGFCESDARDLGNALGVTE